MTSTDRLGEGDGLRIRQAARALILTDAADVLVVRFEFGDATVWALPGGGLEVGESAEHALRRELAEEVGLTDVDIGVHIWSRRHIIPMFGGRWDGQEERVHLVRVPSRFPVNPALTEAELHAEYLHEIRWCHANELDLLADRPGTLFAPRRLPALVTDLVANGPPADPFDVGV